MGLRIQTNIQSMRAQKELGQVRENLNHTQTKLASGSRIVRALDDAAGLAISEKLRATERALGQNVMNAENGMFMLETAEGSLTQITDIVIRMKELAIQAASDTNGDQERSYLSEEYEQKKAELDRIAYTTEFNGRLLLTGDEDAIQIQVGPNNDDELDRIEVTATHAVTLDSLDLGDLEITSVDGARDSIEPINEALEKISAVRGAIGASEARLLSTIANLREASLNISSAYSRIRDADMAHETAELAKYNILSQAGVAVLSQANASPQLALKLLG